MQHITCKACNLLVTKAENVKSQNGSTHLNANVFNGDGARQVNGQLRAEGAHIDEVGRHLDQGCSHVHALASNHKFNSSAASQMQGPTKKLARGREEAAV